MMRHSIQPRGQIFLKRYGFLYFAKIKGKNVGKVINRKYNQQPFSIKLHTHTAEWKKKQVNATQMFNTIFLSGY